MTFKIFFLIFWLIPYVFCQNIHHPYSTSLSVDGSVFGTAAIVALTASSVDEKLTTLTIPEIQSLNKRNINPIDRLTAGWYSKEQSTLSDLLVGGSILSPILFVFDSKMRSDFKTISTMYLETVIFATFMPSYGKGLVRRVRPYAYGLKAPLQEKQDNETLRSFYSGHATWAFATSVFFATVYIDYHPDTEYRKIIWGGAIGLASAVSLLRVTSGAHFLSDIAIGAAVGTSIGYIIPYFHRTGNESMSIHPILSPDYTGAFLRLRLQ
ncbi:MAG: phosphatase PAP2 family protein [Bacteriovoracaceae bacterium]|nr:phosphatase PAP2 family protein [Bacteroidota bacterium]